MTARIYTRRGDAGETDHPAGSRVAKDDPDLEFLGTLDELGAHVGLAVALAADLPATERAALQSMLREIQETLLALPSQIHRSGDGAPLSAATARVEKLIDELSAALPPLDRFIVQGGHSAAAELHVARTVCRRAERRLVTCLRSVKVNSPAYLAAEAYLNRLSDLLFVAARRANQIAGRPD